MINRYYSLICFTIMIFINIHSNAQSMKSAIQDILPTLEQTYLYLHQNPELSLQELNTSRLLVDRLSRMGYEIIYPIGGYGLAAILRNGDGPTLLVRTDMDALPIQEMTGASYASTAKGVLTDGTETYIGHMCGHDLHMTVLLGTAQVLLQQRQRWKGTLILIGQPSEENGMGAYHMMQDGLYTKIPYPDAAIALHDHPFLPAGQLGVKSGPLMAGVDMINITIYGEGGHGAAPHTTIDPIVLSAQMILAFQTIISREINPTDAAVLTVGSLQSGSIHNVIPDKAELKLTVRSYDLTVRNQIIESIKRIAEHQALAAGVPSQKLPIISVREPFTPPLINDEGLHQLAYTAFSSTFGPENVVPAQSEMIGEDFSQYGLQEKPIPIYMFYLGALNTSTQTQFLDNNEPLPGLHSPYFLPDYKKAIPLGVEAMSTLAIELFNKL